MIQLTPFLRKDQRVKIKKINKDYIYKNLCTQGCPKNWMFYVRSTKNLEQEE